MKETKGMRSVRVSQNHTKSSATINRELVGRDRTRKLNNARVKHSRYGAALRASKIAEITIAKEIEFYE